MKEQVQQGAKVEGGTYLVSYELYKEGKTVDEIAAVRHLSASTIISHLVKLYDEGESIDLKVFVKKQEYEQIIAKANELGIKKEDAMKPLFESLEMKYDYGKIKAAMSIAAREGFDK